VVNLLRAADAAGHDRAAAPRAAYCLVILTANLVAHLVADDLHETAPVAIIGLWIGYPFWCSAFALGSDRLAAYVLRLNTTPAPRRPPPRRVRAWTTADPSGPQPTPPTGSPATADELSTADDGEWPSFGNQTRPVGYYVTFRTTVASKKEA
jgi:hypothetical protein